MGDVAFIHKEAGEHPGGKSSFDLNTWERDGLLSEKSVRVVIENDKISVYKIYHNALARVAAWLGNKGFEWAKKYAEAHTSIEHGREIFFEPHLINRNPERVCQLLNLEVRSIVKHDTPKTDKVDQIAQRMLVKVPGLTKSFEEQTLIDKVQVISQQKLAALHTPLISVKAIQAEPLKDKLTDPLTKPVEDPKQLEVAQSSQRISNSAKIMGVFVVGGAIAYGLYSGLGLGSSQPHEVRAGGPGMSGASTGTLPAFDLPAWANQQAFQSSTQSMAAFSHTLHQYADDLNALRAAYQNLDIMPGGEQTYKSEFSDSLHEYSDELIKLGVGYQKIGTFSEKYDKYEADLKKFVDAFLKYQTVAEEYLKAPNTATQKDRDFNEALRTKLDARKQTFESLGAEFSKFQSKYATAIDRLEQGETEVNYPQAPQIPVKLNDPSTLLAIPPKVIPPKKADAKPEKQGK